ncbi:NERD domain-containing protein [Chitinophaga pendula]|uniref:NERD domain-containing protein n=1 Tax=Chitinophaga TaxID=79328 RepID=UPI000BB068E0|nr:MULTISPECIES: NERD domain-containing protein [Chitinophaga]ASZ13270.1 hypothetical protein CK934_21045 [Chitinophaga sp. MD30]UCJ09107.1 NERD domain-containing protein [Chitinophaga pendula]
MELDSTNVHIYIGAPVEVESERKLLIHLLKILSTNREHALIFANLHINNTQIDFIVVTEEKIIVIEAKGQLAAIHGIKNGAWKTLVTPGVYKPTRNYYEQTLKAKHAVKDAITSFFGVEPDYPDAVLAFVPRIPLNSSLPESDHKVKIEHQESLTDLSGFKKNNTFSLEDWKKFAIKNGLINISNVNSAIDKKIFDAEALIKKYLNNFNHAYEYYISEFVEFECSLENTIINTGDVVKLSNIHILGPSGCGKSLLSKKIGFKNLDTENVPLIIEAKYFGTAFRALLENEVLLLGAPSLKEFLNACTRLNLTLLIILDGYNECPLSEQRRLARSLLALGYRYSTKFIVTSQKEHEHLKILNLTQIAVIEPSLEVKKQISGLISGSPDQEIYNSLLMTVRSGLESRIIGQIGNDLPKGTSQFALFDFYARIKLNEYATDGIQALALFANCLSDRVAFSLTIREFDRFAIQEGVSTKILDHLFRTQLLIKHGDRVSFYHELFFHTFIAENIIRNAQNNPEKIASALTSPKHQDGKTFILGAVDNDMLLKDILERTEDYRLIISIAVGDCGKFADEWVKYEYGILLDSIRTEIEGLSFKISETELNNILIENVKTWTKKELALINALPELIIQGKYFSEIIDMIYLMDEKLDSAHGELREQAKKLDIALRSSLFSTIYVGFGKMSAALGLIVSKIHSGILLFSNIRTNNIVYDVERIDKLNLSNGQLYFLLAICRVTRDYQPLIPHFAYWINEKWRYIPYHLKLDLLHSCMYCREDEKERLAVIDALHSLPQDMHVFLSTSLFEALQSLGALDEDEKQYESVVKNEINQVLIDPLNNDSELLAYRIYSSFFDHPYSGSYYSVYSELPPESQKILLTSALRGGTSSNFFINPLIRDLSAFNDFDSGDIIKEWTKLPERNNSFPQDSMRVLFTAYATLGKLNYPLESRLDDANESTANALIACAEILYWCNRSDLANKEKHYKRIFDVLDRHELGASLDAIKQVEREFNSEYYKDENKITSIAKKFPEKVAEICRKALLNRSKQKSYLEWERIDQSLDFAVQILGIYGSKIDLPLLRSLVDDNLLGQTSIKSIRYLEAN